MEWEAVAADPCSHPLQAIEAVQQRLTAYGPTLRCRLMANKVIRALLKFNDFSVAKQSGVRPVAIREAAKSLKATLAAAIALKTEQRQLEDEQNGMASEPLEAPPIEALEENVNTTFDDGSTWTLRNGKPERVEVAHV